MAIGKIVLWHRFAAKSRAAGWKFVESRQLKPRKGHAVRLGNEMLQNGIVKASMRVVRIQSADVCWVEPIFG